MSVTGVKIVMRAPSEDALEIDLMNEIVHDQLEADWFGGTTAQDFSAKVAGKTPKSITVRINSNGGSVSDGVAIYNTLREKARAGAKITTINMGIAASISSVVLAAGDVRRAATGSRTMIHNSGIMGRVPFMQSADLRKTADDLDKINNQIAEIYAKASGGKKTKEDFLALMAVETTLSASEAVDHGLATETDPELQAVALGESFVAVCRGGSAPKPNQQENIRMDITMEKLVAENPEIVAALRQEGRELAIADRATENARIQNILALKKQMPGHEAEIEAMAFDGKTSVEVAKARLFDLETATRNQAANVLRTPAAPQASVPGAAPSAPLAAALPTGSVPSNETLEARCQREWDTKPELRNEFDELKDYLAFEKGKAAGSVNLYSRKEG